MAVDSGIQSGEGKCRLVLTAIEPMTFCAICTQSTNIILKNLNATFCLSKGTLWNDSENCFFSFFLSCLVQVSITVCFHLRSGYLCFNNVIIRNTVVNLGPGCIFLVSFQNVRLQHNNITLHYKIATPRLRRLTSGMTVTYHLN